MRRGNRRVQFSLVLLLAACATQPLTLDPYSGSLDALSEPTAKVILRPRLEYPRAERIARVEGITELIFDLAEDGSVKKVWLKTSSGSKALDEAAARMLLETKYESAHTGIYKYKFIFRIKDEGA